VQQKQLQQLRDETQSLTAELAKLKAENEVALAAAQSQNEELERVRKDATELLRWRGEVGQLRQQVQIERQRVVQQPTAAKETTRPATFAPGTYIPKDQLAFAGYATPEAAVQSAMWAFLSGQQETALAAVGPKTQRLLGNSNTWKQATAASDMAMMKGFQILAKKVIASDYVELKIRVDFDAGLPNTASRCPDTLVSSVFKFGEEWKLDDDSKEFTEAWQRDGQIQTYAP
jgi:hypothetical protein